MILVPKEELSKIDRMGVCVSCHQTVPDKDVAINLLSHVAKYGNVKIDNRMHSGILNKSIRITAWVQVLLGVMVIFGIALFVWIWLKKRKKKST